MRSIAAVASSALLLIACGQSGRESPSARSGHAARNDASVSGAPSATPGTREPDAALESGATMRITSRAFRNGQTLPADYTCDGRGTNPPLSFSDVPPATKSLALIVDDPDAPGGVWDHWIAWNIQPVVSNLAEAQAAPGVTGRNSWARNEWGAPCPPSGQHRYFFRIYALDTMLQLDESAYKATLQTAMKGHILASGTLLGVYERKKK